MHQSVATLDNPEFINLEPLDISPMISKCEIKVMYLGKNRNRTMITKDVAADMAKTLRGNPIVGCYKEDVGDFRDHGEKITIDADGIHFNVETQPYGFVAPDAKVWFQKFVDTNDFGEEIEREYLMTEGYLWTGQYEECQSVIDEGKSQSMEIDEKTMEGKWDYSASDDMEYFIISDGMFSKLCILGDDIEPCFEGASITAPNISAKFSKKENNNENVIKTLYSMMSQLTYALKGGEEMANENEKTVTAEEPVVQETTVVENPVVEEPTVTDPEPIVETPTSEFKKEDEDKSEKSNTDKKEDSTTDDNSKDSTDNKEDSKDDKDKKTDYAVQYAELSSKFDKLQSEYEVLLKYQKGIENEKKMQMIESFYMLSDEDKKEVTENIDKYSLDDIEKELSVICVRKKVNFSLDEESTKKNDNPAVTYSLDDSNNSDNVPAWVAAVKRTRDSQ